MPARRLARPRQHHPHRRKSKIPREPRLARLPPHRRRQLRLAQARAANGRQRSRHAQLSQAKLPSGESPDIIGIVVNEQGLDRALATPGVTTIGYPYSISAYFRRANANMSRAESRALVEKLQRETKAAGRKLVIYISMAFGNPYDEPWGPEIVEDTLIWLKDVGVRLVSLADTVGTASPEDVAQRLQRREKLRRGRRDRRASAQPSRSRRGKSSRRLRSRMPPLRWRAHRTGRLPFRGRRTCRQHSHRNRSRPRSPRAAWPPESTPNRSPLPAP